MVIVKAKLNDKFYLNDMDAVILKALQAKFAVELTGSACYAPDATPADYDIIINAPSKDVIKIIDDLGPDYAACVDTDYDGNTVRIFDSMLNLICCESEDEFKKWLFMTQTMVMLPQVYNKPKRVALARLLMSAYILAKG